MARAPASWGNLRKALSNPHTRLVFGFAMGLPIIVIVLAMAWMRSTRTSDAYAEVAEVRVPPATSRDRLPPATQERVDALTDDHNAQVYAAAQQQGESAIPVPRVGQAAPEEDRAPPPAAGHAAQQAAPPPSSAVDPKRDARVAQLVAAMGKQYDLNLARWSAPAQVQHVTYAGALPEGSAAVPSSTTPAADVRAAPPVVASIRASDVVLGAALGAANTDDGLPLVRGRLLAGPARGAVVMGTIEVTGESPGGLVRFTKLVPAGGGASIDIDAVAVSPSHGRPSVGKVNRHTASRMGALFASSLLGGVSDALLAGGRNEQVVAGNNATVVQRDRFSATDIGLIGLGRVGTNSAALVERMVARPATATLRANQEFGVLFLQDVILDASEGRAQ